MAKELLIIEPENYNEQVLNIVEEVSKKSKKIAYISLNKTYNAIIQLLQKRKMEVNKFLFIDTISSSILPEKKSPNVVFVESLGSVKSTGILMDKIKDLSKNVDTIIFDSLSSLLIYIDEKEALSWLNNLISFAEGKNIDIFLFVLESDKNKEAIKQVEMRVDKSRVIGAKKAY